MMTISRALLLALPLAACGADEPVEKPTPLAAVSPFQFPVTLWDQGVEGETLLMVRVTTQGAVDSAFVERSSGYAAFDSAALAGARELRFMPARKGDKRVASWARIPVKFSKEGAAAPGAPEALP